MTTISTIERVQLNYSGCTIATIILYTFFIQLISQSLWATVLFFNVAECIKMLIVHKLYSLDVSNNLEGLKKRRNNKIGDSFKFAVLILFTTLSYGLICIILGAPALENYEQTLTLSALLTSLTLFPVSLFVGVSGTMAILFTDSFDLMNAVSQGYLKLLKRNSFLAIFGAFVGSVVFPLDWDRWYQVYPIPNIVGAITGQMIGCFYCFFATMIKYKFAKKQR